MHDYKSLHVSVMICANLVNTLTDTHTQRSAELKMMVDRHSTQSNWQTGA